MRQTQKYTILDAASSTGAGNSIFVEDFRHITIDLSTANNANCTIKVQGSTEENPNFDAAQSVSNPWDYVELIDLEDGKSIDGDSGIVLTGTDDHRLLEINSNILKSFTVNIVAYTAGNITAKALLSSN